MDFIGICACTLMLVTLVILLKVYESSDKETASTKQRSKDMPDLNTNYIKNWQVSGTVLSDDLSSYTDLESEEILTDVRNLIPASCINDVAISGGFASYVSGVTNSFGDVDIFCFNEQSFERIVRSLPVPHTGPHERPTYGTVVKFEIDGQKYDLVDISNLIMTPIDRYADQTQLETITYLFETFDFNWCMSAIDLSEDRIYTHSDAFLPHPKIGDGGFSRDPRNIVSRLDRYMSRMVRPVDQLKVVQFATALMQYHDQNPQASKKDFY